MFTKIFKSKQRERERERESNDKNEMYHNDVQRHNIASIKKGYNIKILDYIKA